MHPLERQLNLIALLLEARNPLPFREIRDLLPAYQQEDTATAKRQFERDKDALRAIGIPIELAPTDVWEVEEGYHIPKDRYYLPEISFTGEEAAALFVAAQAPGEGGLAAQAFRKLATQADAGVIAALPELPGPTGVEASGPHLPAVAEAVARRRKLRFRYRPMQGEEAERTVDAWGLVFRKGSWYLVGRDEERDEPRSYRLSRVTGVPTDVGEGAAAPEGFRAGELLTAGPWGFGEPDTTARVAFSPKVAWWATAGLPGARTLARGADGWTEAEVPAATSDVFVAWILSFGPDAVVLAPEELRAAVLARLEAIGA